MKKLLRSALVQGVLGWLIAAYVELVIATQQWRYENDGPGRAAIEGPEGVIVLFWHGRIVSAIALRPFLKAKPRRVMISLSRDGAFIARAAERLGIPTIRGSTGRAEGGGAKGGAAAFREALEFLGAGGVMIMTPDGPRGPNRVMQLGPVQLARASGRPVFLLGVAARPAIRLGSWDQGQVPMPFARAALVLDGPHRVAGAADAPAVEATRLDWQRRLDAAQDRARDILDQGR